MSSLEENCVPSSSRIERLQQWQQCYPSDLSCPICLQTANFPVETNCGHVFCGEGAKKRIGINMIERSDIILKCLNPQIPCLEKGYCLIEYWKHGSWLSAINCPLCRQKVVSLHTCSENQPDKKNKQTFYDIRMYNKCFSGQPQSFIDHLYDMPLLLPVILRGISTLAALMWIFLFRVVICLLGTIMCMNCPAEGMPEPLCRILQTADNVAVVILLLISFINICPQMESEDANRMISRE